MSDPAFTVLWLVSLIVVSAGLLRFALRAILIGWFLIGEAAGALARRAPVAALAKGRDGWKARARRAPPGSSESRSRHSGADSRAAA
jgi:hypothetical protein